MRFIIKDKNTIEKFGFIYIFIYIKFLIKLL